MPDYKELYFSIFRATEKAISILIEAQRKAEEMVVSDETQEITVLPVQNDGA